jgi:hypothetical protein
VIDERLTLEVRETLVWLHDRTVKIVDQINETVLVAGGWLSHPRAKVEVFLRVVAGDQALRIVEVYEPIAIVVDPVPALGHAIARRALLAEHLAARFARGFRRIEGRLARVPGTRRRTRVRGADPLRGARQAHAEDEEPARHRTSLPWWAQARQHRPRSESATLRRVRTVIHEGFETAYGDA